jgi:hypothetical protein
MEVMEFCGTCGVPRSIGRDLTWKDNGSINHTLSSRGRMVFYESDTIDRLFKGIEDLIGLPIEHIAIESRRRDMRKFMEKSFWGKIEESQRLAEEERSARSEEERKVRRKSTMKLRLGLGLQASDLGRAYGYGSVQADPHADPKDEFPWRSQVVRNPYSLVFYAGDQLGTVEAFEQSNMRITYEELDNDVFRFMAFPGEHPIGLQERLKRNRYDFKEGNLSFQRCPECDIPIEVSSYRWRPEDGTITDPRTGMRMAFFEPSTLEAVLDDLAAELGDPILDIAIEAQRRYIKDSASSGDWRHGEAFFRNWAALRGLGNIVSFKAPREGTTLCLQNACLPLALVGTAQAFYEMALGLERSSCEWEYGEDGDLTISMRA